MAFKVQRSRRNLFASAALWPALGASWMLAAAEYAGQPYAGDDLFADTWVATDGAGRIVPAFEECGPPRPGKQVGIFYWTWHVPQPGGPNDNTRLAAPA